MSRITRQKLSHGAKLVPEQLNTSIAATKNIVLNNKIDKNNLSVNKNVFYVSLNIPVIRSTWGEDNSGRMATSGSVLETPFPFMLIPNQDLFKKDFHTTEKNVVLEELMFSFDQNANSLAMTDYYDSEGEGLLFEGVSENYTVRLKLYEKTPCIITGDYFNNLTPDLLIYQADLPSNLFNSVRARNNPYVIGNINLNLDPYKTYIITISFPTGLAHKYSSGVDDFIRNVMLPSVNIRAKCSNILEKFFEGSERTVPPTIQNLPISFQEIFKPIGTVNKWSAGGSICATTYTSGSTTYPGIQTEIESLDKLAIKGYVGGLTPSSDNRTNQSLLSEYGYDIITVPLFQNIEQVRRSMIYHSYDKRWLPYVPYLSGSEMPNSFMDRRMINIPYPFIIHQVICSVSFMANPTLLQTTHISSSQDYGFPGDYRPESNTTSREVGIVIGTGIRSDHSALQQIAYGKMDDDTMQDYLLDKVQIAGQTGNPLMWGSVNPLYSNSRVGVADTEVWQVPIVGPTRGNYFNSFTDNGHPFFIGESNIRTQIRTDCYDMPQTEDPSHTPNTNGQEQWLEVRGKISDTSEGFSLGTNTNEILLGRGGWFVHIIGKRGLV